MAYNEKDLTRETTPELHWRMIQALTWARRDAETEKQRRNELNSKLNEKYGGGVQRPRRKR